MRPSYCLGYGTHAALRCDSPCQAICNATTGPLQEPEACQPVIHTGVTRTDDLPITTRELAPFWRSGTNVVASVGTSGAVEPSRYVERMDPCPIEIRPR